MVLRVVLIAEDICITLKGESNSLAQAEGSLKTATAEQTNLCAIPDIIKIIGIKRLERFGNHICIVIAPGNVSTTTNKSRQVEHTVGVPTTEQIAQIEHQVNTGSHILILVVVGVRLRTNSSAETVPATLTLPGIGLETGSKHGAELIAQTQLYVRRDQF